MNPALRLIVSMAGLLAEHGQLADMGRHFRSPDVGLQWSQMLGAGGLIVLLILVALLAAWLFQWRERRGFRHPGLLFRELCAAHQLAWKERRLLRQLARLHALPQPALVFAQPEYCTAPPDSGLDEPLIRQLQTRLFGETESENAP